MTITVPIYLASLVAFYFAQRADARATEEGFARGYGEGNELIVKLFGPKPSSTKLQLFNFAQLVVVSAAFTLAGYIPIGWTAGAILMAGKSLLAVRKWRRAFATNGASLMAGRTWWQKFLGI